MPQFHETGLGASFFSVHVPSIVRSLADIALAMSRPPPEPPFSGPELALLRETLRYYIDDGVPVGKLSPYRELEDRVKRMLPPDSPPVARGKGPDR